MEPTLAQILDAREMRVSRQNELLGQFQKPLLCFTMNIPGPVKLDRDIAIGFFVGCSLLRQSLGDSVLHFEAHYRHTGCECYCVADLPARQLKQTALDLEEMGAVGRLFDMDVLDTDGKKLSREEMGMPPRKCLLCDNDAFLCASTRAHSLEELKARTGFLLYLAARQYFCEYIAVQACQALIREVRVTPKPGLVDGNNSGAHKDMDIRHFFASAQALRPYFCRCAETGYLNRELPAPQILEKLRPLGLEAEKTMYKATFGANTHKGAIFSMGLLCAAAGSLSPGHWTAQALCDQCAAMCKGITKELQTQTPSTAGQRQFAQYGLTGVRGQAEAGFPAVSQVGLPVLREGLRRGLSENHALAATLLHLLAAIDDTNLISRGGRQTQLALKDRIARKLSEDPYPELGYMQSLDTEFIREGLSPGGSADLLALVCFLHTLLE